MNRFCVLIALVAFVGLASAHHNRGGLRHAGFRHQQPQHFQSEGEDSSDLESQGQYGARYQGFDEEEFNPGHSLRPGYDYETGYNKNGQLPHRLGGRGGHSCNTCFGYPSGHGGIGGQQRHGGKSHHGRRHGGSGRRGGVINRHGFGGLDSTTGANQGAFNRQGSGSFDSTGANQGAFNRQGSGASDSNTGSDNNEFNRQGSDDVESTGANNGEFNRQGRFDSTTGANQGAFNRQGSGSSDSNTGSDNNEFNRQGSDDVESTGANNGEFNRQGRFDSTTGANQGAFNRQGSGSSDSNTGSDNNEFNRQGSDDAESTGANNGEFNRQGRFDSTGLGYGRSRFGRRPSRIGAHGAGFIAANRRQNGFEGRLGASNRGDSSSSLDAHRGLSNFRENHFNTGINRGENDDLERLRKHQVINKEKTTVNDKTNGVNDVDAFRHSTGSHDNRRSDIGNSVGSSDQAGLRLNNQREFDNEFNAGVSGESSDESALGAGIGSVAASNE